VGASSPSVVLTGTEAASVVQHHARLLAERLPSVERIPLYAAAGRILAQPIVADRDQPPFPRSTRDGYACRSRDLRGTLLIVGQIRAGETWDKPPIGPGETAEIMTGAPVPPGADCVVMVEHVIADGRDVRLRTEREMEYGENIVQPGAEARAGSVIVPAGTRMGPAQIAAAAACGESSPEVFARPRVAVVATGDELVEAAEQPQHWQIRNSNSYSLAAQISAHGGGPVIFPIVPDDSIATQQAITEALSCDLILLTGGVSMGRFDFVEQALLTLGAEFFFTGAKIQPGKPVVFGKLPAPNGERYFFGLPGNPLSTMVTFALFAAPLLAAISGSATFEPDFAAAQLEEDVKVTPGLTRFLPAVRASCIDGTRVKTIPWHGSGDLASAAKANCFLVVPDDAAQLSAGQPVTVLLI
jgi:molybdopterin molybdotransferase